MVSSRNPEKPIIIFNSNPGVAEFISEVIRQIPGIVNPEILHAHNSQSAQLLLTEHPTAHLIFDHNLPTQDGRPFASQIRSKYPNAQMTVTSTESQPWLPSDYQKRGVPNYIQLPEDLDQLSRKFAAALSILEKTMGL